MNLYDELTMHKMERIAALFQLVALVVIALLVWG